MIYYAKPNAPRPDIPPIDFSRLRERLDFRQTFISHADNRNKYIKAAEDHSPLFPDFAAAVIAQLQRTKTLDKKYVKYALEYCRVMIQEAGYEPTDLPSLTSGADQIRNIVLVFGCQGPEVRDARAKACYRLARELRHIRLNIVFSGRNPSKTGDRQYVLTRNEAGDLQQEFYRLIEHDNSFGDHRNFSVALEENATSTHENIVNFLQEDSNPGNPSRLFLLSSTFHLGRISSDVDKALTESPKHKASVRQIVLVGAEDDPDDEIVQEDRYVKAMMFEVFDHMFRSSPLEPKPDTSYQGAV